MRLFALTLIFANLLYFAWGNGLLRAAGFAPAQQSEPQRLAQQIQPDAVRLLSAAEFKKVERQLQADLAPKECLLAGPFDETQMMAIGKSMAAALPPDSFQWDTQAQPARWIVYMGKYASPEAQQKKRTELQTLNLKIESLLNPALEPGFSLGAYETKPLADAALQRFNARGVHTARVVQEREEGKVYQLRLPQVDESLKARLANAKAALGNRNLHSCQ